jgi:preprotein translocase subunit SecB
MNAPESIESGYVLEALYFPLQQIGPDHAEDEGEHTDIAWGWDWRWNDADRFEVGLMLGIPPTTSRPEKLEVAATAVFRVVGVAQTVQPTEFAHTHAPAVLFPYVRQVVDELTSRSPYGRVLLPPTNVVALMGNFEPAESTGAKQRRPKGRGALLEPAGS